MRFVNTVKEYVKEKMHGPKIYFMVGPTACGKTAYSIKLAKELEYCAAAKGRRTICEIISADSRQVFKDFDLLSGKVTHAEMQDIPHHMLDLVLPGQYFSAIDFSKLACQKIQEIISRGHTPIIVGGTGFYIDNLLYNYNLPKVPANPELKASLKNLTTEEIFIKLKNLDQNYAEREFENKNNRHRMERALEIAIAIGHVPPLVKSLRFKNIEIINLKVEKEVLYSKIYKRLEERINQGMIEELIIVRNKFNLSNEYLESLGLEFKYISLYLQGKLSKIEMQTQLFEAIKKYSKRQVTWFKRYDYL